MRGGSCEREILKMRKVKVGTLGTTVQSPWLQGLRWNITWNNARTKRHFVGMFVLDRLKKLCYALLQSISYANIEIHENHVI